MLNCENRFILQQQQKNHMFSLKNVHKTGLSGLWPFASLYSPVSSEWQGKEDPAAKKRAANSWFRAYCSFICHYHILLFTTLKLIEGTLYQNCRGGFLLIVYEHIKALTLIWRPPGAHFGVWKNSAKMNKIVYFHTCQGKWDWDNTKNSDYSLSLGLFFKTFYTQLRGT